MLLSLQSPALVERLVVVDIAPVVYGHSHLPLIEAMRSVDLGAAARRADVDAALRERIPDDAMRLFLLQNLATRDGRLVWRINLEALAAGMDRLLGFPELAAEAIFEQPALFVAASCPIISACSGDPPSCAAFRRRALPSSPVPAIGCMPNNPTPFCGSLKASSASDRRLARTDVRRHSAFLYPFRVRRADQKGRRRDAGT